MRSRLTAVALLALVAGGALAKAQAQVYKPETVSVNVGFRLH